MAVSLNLQPDAKGYVSTLKDDGKCPADALRVCVFIYLLYILKNNAEFGRK